jgi:hypothetical protein
VVVIQAWDYYGQMSNSESNAIPAIQVPTGGQLRGFANLQIQSTKCSADTNLQTQVAPLLASMTCQLKMLKLLKLLKPLIDVIKGLPNPPRRPFVLLGFDK